MNMVYHKIDVKEELQLLQQLVDVYSVTSSYFQKQPPEVFCMCQSLNFIKKESLAQVFSCEFYEISKNTFFTEHLRTTASVFSLKKKKITFQDFLKIFAKLKIFVMTGNLHKAIIDTIMTVDST